MKKDLTDKEKEERMNYLTIHKCKNEDERKELKELCDLNLLVLKNDDTFVLTKRGTEVANIVWEKFI